MPQPLILQNPSMDLEISIHARSSEIYRTLGAAIHEKKEAVAALSIFDNFVYCIFQT